MIYVNARDREVSLNVPVVPVNGMEVTISQQGQLVHEADVVTFDGDSTYSTTIPFHLVSSDRELDVRWKFQYLEGTQTYEYDQIKRVAVVTPILELEEIRSIVGEDFDDDLSEVERSVRYIIQAHTGQTFGKFVGTKSISGNGEPYLRLPARLLSYTKVNGNEYWKDILTLRGNGWYLQNHVRGIPPVRADFEGLHYHPTTGAISAPAIRRNYEFTRNSEFVVDGVWGWESVPEPVREAARLLVNDYACGDSLYRDRFINSIKSADWTIQFNSGAFSSTGNVRANQLLTEYVLKRGWVVV